MADVADNVRAEQFWFTLTTLGVNGSLIADATRDPSPRWILLISFSALLSLFAAYLVVERSAFLVHGPMVPSDFPKGEGAVPWQEKQREFRYKLAIVRDHLPYVWHETSGSLFYLLLIIGSFLGVVGRWLGHL